ncbi:MAG TPA: histidine kinase [Methanoregulaceae archaeon]|nr:histidine kinase [Methanoregulaceae archaeon]
MDPRHSLFAILLIAALCAAGCTTAPPANTTPTTTATATPCVACGVNSPSNPLANLTVDEQRLVAFVNEAAAYAKSNGRETALTAFNNRNGSFIRRDLYVFAYDMNGTVLALPFQPEIVGTNRSGAVDLNGVAYIRDAITAARNGSGFFRYHYPNPARNFTVEQKTSYVIGLGDWFLGAGVYTPDPVAATVPLRSRAGLVTFVEQAAAYARANGKDRAILAFNDPNGSFVEDDLYVFAYDMNGTTLALPFQHELIGVNRSDAADIRGTKFIKAGVSAAQNGSGFYELRYPNPADGYAVEPKTCYVVGMGDWYIGSGYYSARTNTSVNSSAMSTKEELATFVEKAAAHARARGREPALGDFNNRTGPFASGDVYVYALDYNGTALALPFQPDKIGMSFLNATDSTGQYYTRVEIELARNGGGFVYYDYPNPDHSMASEPKMSYVQDVDGRYWIGAGTSLPVVNETATR